VLVKGQYNNLAGVSTDGAKPVCDKLGSDKTTWNPREGEGRSVFAMTVKDATSRAVASMGLRASGRGSQNERAKGGPIPLALSQKEEKRTQFVHGP
jgi:hypothetical protein